MNRIVSAGLAAVIAIGLGAGAWAQDITIKFSHVVAPDTPKGKGAEKFKELAEQYTEGKVKVEIYPNSQLYKDKEELEALQLGAVQMLAPSLAKFGPLGVQQFELFDLPMLFANRDDLRKITDGEVGKGLLAKLEDKGIKGLAYWAPRFLTACAVLWPVRRLEEHMTCLGRVWRVGFAGFTGGGLRRLSALGG